MAEPRAPRLERRERFELRQRGLQPLEQRKRHHSPAVLGSPLHAARVAVADTVEAGGVRHRERAEHDGVDQREDGRRAANTERQREDRRCREDASAPELPGGVADIAKQRAHVALRRRREPFRCAPRPGGAGRPLTKQTTAGTGL